MTKYSDFFKLTSPFSRFHQIFFKQDTIAFQAFGPFVFGRFLKNQKKPELVNLDNQKVMIDAPKIDGRNQLIQDSDRSSLYFIGIYYTDIDFEQTYPNLPI